MYVCMDACMYVFYWLCSGTKLQIYWKEHIAKKEEQQLCNQISSWDPYLFTVYSHLQNTIFIEKYRKCNWNRKYKNAVIVEDNVYVEYPGGGGGGGHSGTEGAHLSFVTYFAEEGVFL